MILKPPFTKEIALKKTRIAENLWNSRSPEKIALAYTENCYWRNRDLFFIGRPKIVEFLTNKYNKEKNYKLIKELFCYTDDRIAVRFQYEWYNEKDDQYIRSYGNEYWQFEESGLMKRREASINDVIIKKEDLKFTWEGDDRPQNFPGLTELGL
eukprot:TRINITY_DN8347_c0_g1_i1.p1 TRINITY_DN8347_c0_g1~~TRINITY_DN8347_c0_g1_i1.p1  ORF type:complete len:154 (-),score=27.05 TRINITY_DN8347_c0_g1_i1:84-545(-)